MAVSQFSGATDCVTAASHGCPILKAPSNAAEKCSRLFPGFEGSHRLDPSRPQRIPGFIARSAFGVHERPHLRRPRPTKDAAPELRHSPYFGGLVNTRWFRGDAVSLID